MLDDHDLPIQYSFYVYVSESVPILDKTLHNSSLEKNLKKIESPYKNEYAKKAMMSSLLSSLRCSKTKKPPGICISINKEPKIKIKLSTRNFFLQYLPRSKVGWCFLTMMLSCRIVWISFGSLRILRGWRTPSSRRIS